MTKDQLDSENDKEVIWAICEEMGRGERHFNELQTGYRKLAASWILALFGALAFLLFPSDDGSQRIETGAAMAFTLALALVALAGVVALWILDLHVYHRLLLAYFFAGKDLEDRYPWLPKVRHYMSALNHAWPVLKKLVLFYVVCLAICVGLGIASFRELMSDSPAFGPTFGIWAFFSFVIATFVLYFLLTKITKTDDKILSDAIDHQKSGV